MTITVSVSELRNNISEYLDRAMGGDKVLIRDEKRNLAVAQMSQAPTFDSDRYGKILQKVAGTLTAANHPEWKTIKSTNDWLTRTRLSDERVF